MDLEGNRSGHPCEAKDSEDRVDVEADGSDYLEERDLDLDVPQEGVVEARSGARNFGLNLDDPEVVYHLLPEVHIRDEVTQDASIYKTRCNGRKNNHYL